MNLQYPVQIIVKPYKGKDQNKISQWHQNIQIANRISKWLNGQLSDLSIGEVRQFDYCDIAIALDIEKNKIKRILFANGGGSNGITISR